MEIYDGIYKSGIKDFKDIYRMGMEKYLERLDYFLYILLIYLFFPLFLDFHNLRWLLFLVSPVHDSHDRLRKREE